MKLGGMRGHCEDGPIVRREVRYGRVFGGDFVFGHHLLVAVAVFTVVVVVHWVIAIVLDHIQDVIVGDELLAFVDMLVVVVVQVVSWDVRRHSESYSGCCPIICLIESTDFYTRER